MAKFDYEIIITLAIIPNDQIASNFYVKASISYNRQAVAPDDLPTALGSLHGGGDSQNSFLNGHNSSASRSNAPGAPRRINIRFHLQASLVPVFQRNDALDDLDAKLFDALELVGMAEKIKEYQGSNDETRVILECVGVEWSRSRWESILLQIPHHCGCEETAEGFVDFDEAMGAIFSFEVEMSAPDEALFTLRDPELDVKLPIRATSEELARVVAPLMQMMRTMQRAPNNQELSQLFDNVEHDEDTRR